MVTGALPVLLFNSQSGDFHREMHPQAPFTASKSRDVSSSTDPRLRTHMPVPHRSRKESLLTGIKWVFEQRKRKKESDRCKRDLGLDSWDGFAWAEQRQDNGRRVKRDWDPENKLWKVVSDWAVERCISPCDMSKVTREDEDVEEETTEEETTYDPFYEAPTISDSPNEMQSVGGSALDCSEDSNATVHLSTLARASDQSDDILCSEIRDGDSTSHHGFETADDAITLVHKSTPDAESSATSSRPSLTTTTKYLSLRRAAIWNAACKAGQKGMKFWTVEDQGREEGANKTKDWRRTPSAFSRRPKKGSRARPSKRKLDGLAKLLNSIDAERVNTVRHIWHADKNEWSHVRDASTQTNRLD